MMINVMITYGEFYFLIVILSHHRKKITWGISVRHICSIFLSYETKTKLRGLSPQANSTDRATAACRRS
jgi:hypothetical protein